MAGTPDGNADRVTSNLPVKKKGKGGYRGGRKPGSKNKRKITPRQIDRMRKDMEDPKDYLSGCISGRHEFDPQKAYCAVNLMPYIYARMAATKITGSLDATHEQALDLIEKAIAEDAAEVLDVDPDEVEISGELVINSK